MRTRGIWLTWALMAALLLALPCAAQPADIRTDTDVVASSGNDVVEDEAVPAPMPPHTAIPTRRLPPLPIDEEDEGPVGKLVATEPGSDVAKDEAVVPAEPAHTAIPNEESSDIVKDEAVAPPVPPHTATSNRNAARRNAEALRHFEAKDYPKALAALRAAYDLDSQSAEIVNNLAYLLHTLGNRDEAMRYYREALVLDPGRYTAHINLADLLMERADSEATLAEAAELLMRARELSGNKPSVILRQARVAARRGMFEPARLHYQEYEMRVELSDRRRLEIGDFHRDFGRSDIAARYYREVAGNGVLSAEAKARLEQLELEQAAKRYGWTASLQPVPVRVRTLATRATLFYGRGRLNEARRLLEEALAMAPHYAQARMWLGDVLRDQGDRAAAELTYLRALAIDSGNADIHLRLGDLYLAEPKANRSAEAALFYHNVLQLRPEWTTARLRLVRACQAAGNLAEARSHLDTYLEQVAEGSPEHREALLLRDALAGVLERRGDAGTAAAGAGKALPPGVVEVLNRARGYLEQDRPEAAMLELERLPRENRPAEALNLEGRILHATDQLRAAAERFEESLALLPAQAEAHERLGLVREELGEVEAARGHFEAATRSGSRDAAVHLVRLELRNRTSVLERLEDLVSPGRLWTQRQTLRAYLEGGSDAVFAKEAGALLQEVNSRLQAVALSLVLAVLILVGAAWFTWWHRRGGTDLQTLIRRNPEAGPEVQRVLAAIRHEVLKHNTMMLTGLVQRLEAGEEASSEARHLHQTLFGGPKEEAVFGHLLTYCEQLRQIGRAHGVRLNLRRRDPALAAILRGFEMLERVADALEKVEIATPAKRAALVKQLKEAARLLNVEGYEAVRTLLDGLRVLSVDRKLLEGIVQRIRKEPKLAGVRVVAPVFDLACELPVAVLIPRAAFEDVVGNLVRNALFSGMEAGLEPVRVGMGVSISVDPITGLESFLLAVRDDSPRALTTEMIRGRYIEGGLGLSADLVARYEGSIDVEEGPEGWSKSVVVVLPVAASAEPASRR